MDVVHGLGIVFGFLGMVCSMGYIVLYFVIPELKGQSRKFFLYLSVSNLTLGFNFMTLFLDDKGGDWCIFKFFLMVWANSTQFLWTLAVGIYVFCVCRWGGFHPRGYYAFHTVGWGVPILLAMLILANKPVIVHQGMVEWCFLSPSEQGWMMTVFAVPLFLCWVGSTGLFVMAWRELGKGHLVVLPMHSAAGPVGNPLLPDPNAVRGAMQELKIKLLAVPFGLIPLRVWDVIFGIFFIAGPRRGWPDPGIWLQCLIVVGNCMQSVCLFVGLIIGTQATRDRLFRSVRGRLLSQSEEISTPMNT